MFENKMAQLSPDTEVWEQEQVQTKDWADGPSACPDGQTEDRKMAAGLGCVNSKDWGPAEAPVTVEGSLGVEGSLCGSLIHTLWLSDDKLVEPITFGVLDVYLFIWTYISLMV